MLKSVAIALCLLITSTVSYASDEALPEWLAGGWELTSGTGWGDEYWTPPRGGIMIGAARIGKETALSSFESMRIGYDEGGKLAFWAMPQWTTQSKFLMAKQTDNEIVFENSAHDYPQRVRYWRDGKLLKAEISLINGSKAMQFSFEPMGMK